MEMTKCTSCSGGKIMWLGMMPKDCDNCDGTGKVIAEEDISFLDGKYSESYNKAIGEIKALDPSMSDEKAKKLFDEELNKISSDKKVRKSKRN